MGFSSASASFASRLKEILQECRQGCLCAAEYRWSYWGGSYAWYILVDGESVRVPIGSLSEEIGISYVHHLLSKEFGSTLWGAMLRIERESEGKRYTSRVVFRYQPRVYNYENM